MITCGRSSVKVYSPAITSSNNIEEVEEEIHDCTHIAHPGASLLEFIDSVDEVVESIWSNVF